MYAHKILNDLTDYLPHIKPEHKKYSDALLECIAQIQCSIKFHLPKRDIMKKTAGSAMEAATFLDKEYSKYIRLPYPISYFDYEIDKNQVIKMKKKEISSRRALVACDQGEGISLFIISYMDELDKWFLGEVCWYLTPGGDVRHTTVFEDFMKIPSYKRFYQNYFNPQLETCPALPVFTINTSFMRNEQIDSALKENVDEVYIFIYALLLLNCKNIGTVDIYPDKKLNVKRRTRGKLQLFKYKELYLSFKNYKTDKKESLRKIEHCLHFCRGHFKEFKDKPLFGKYIGLYWWNPHLRGKKERGFVHKDYNLGKFNPGESKNGKNNNQRQNNRLRRSGAICGGGDRVQPLRGF